MLLRYADLRELTGAAAASGTGPEDASDHQHGGAAGRRSVCR